MAYDLKKYLCGEPFFPSSLYGKGLTQKLKEPYGGVAFHLTNNHFTKIVSVDEDIDDSTLRLFDFSLEALMPHNQKPEVKYPRICMAKDLSKVPDPLRYQEIGDAFFSAAQKAGALVQTSEFHEIDYKKATHFLDYIFTNWFFMKKSLGDEKLEWLQEYVKTMKKAITY